MRQRMQSMPVLFLFTALMATIVGTASTMSETDRTEEIALEITIRHSGLFSRKTTVIRYRSGDKAIVAVRENGNNVAEDKLEQYRQMLGDALEVSELQDLIPQLDAANRTFETFGVPDAEKFEELESVLGRLDGLESEFARTQTELLRVRQKLIKYGVVIDRIKTELERSGVELREYDEIVIRDGWLYVDDERMSRELSERCIAIFEEVTGEEVDARGTTLKWKNND